MTPGYIFFKLSGLRTSGDKNNPEHRFQTPNIYGFHRVRHTFITEYIKNGLKINTRSKITGDTIHTLEQYYIHLMEDTIKPAIDNLPYF